MQPSRDLSRARRREKERERGERVLEIKREYIVSAVYFGVIARSRASICSSFLRHLRRYRRMYKCSATSFTVPRALPEISPRWRSGIATPCRFNSDATGLRAVFHPRRRFREAAHYFTTTMSLLRQTSKPLPRTSTSPPPPPLV